MPLICYPAPMQDKSITSTLLHLQVQIVRVGMDGLDHVEALLRLRGVVPGQQHVPRKQPADKFRQAELKRAILEALKGGPQTGKAIAGLNT